ncbi:hypothetical protein GYY_04230 [Methanococcus maripaludis X1]|uniref:PEGA domain-containing protein n=1 Tax=Methanococcus maripaludis X1 TaxID=1053692 RepID=G0H4U0_METMI|nr:hypothetical protein GYY_04230 [Methanococcus maripaludis X1]
MIKRYILFLLILMCAVGTVNAYTTYSTDVQGVNGTSEYYVSMNADYTDELLLSGLESAKWGGYTPVVVGYGDNKIYFASENDLARFLLIQDGYSTPAILFSGDFVAYFNNEPKQVTSYYKVVGPYATGNINFTSDPSTVYLLAVCVREALGSSCVQFNGETLLSGSADTWTHNYVNRIVSGDSNGYLSATARAGDRAGLSWIVIGDSELTEGTFATVLYGPPDMGKVSIYTEPETDVYEGSTLLGTTDNGGLLDIQLVIGEHNLKFVKNGYWDVYETVTANFQNNTELFISLSPKTSIFQVSKEFSGNLYPNSVGTLSMDITPVKDAYASKLRVSGVEVNKVYYKSVELPKGSDGYYILGDVSSTQNIEIDFKTPSSWGEKTFTVELSATDIEGTAYNNLETINYEVLELPFLLEMPETFGIGINDITLTDQSGTAYSVLMVLYDSEGTETWSSSTNLLEYCDYTFEVPVDDAGDYTLELNAKSGTVKTYYSIDIIEPVTLITEEITANPGKIATVQFKISNPTSNVKYYTAELTCPFYNESIAKTFSIAPETVDKTVDISFEVPEGLELENYQLSLEIFDPDKTDAIYSGSIVLTISESSLFLASVPGGNTTLILLAAAVLLIAGTFAALRLKK